MTTPQPHIESPDANFGYSVAPTVRAARDDEGLVLLDLASGDYASFNPVGALVWAQIESGATLTEILTRVRGTFPEVDGEVIDRDVRALLEHLSSDGLITAGGRRGGGGTTISAPTPARDLDPDLGDEGVGLWPLLVAFVYLVYVDLLMRLSRGSRVHEVVGATETRRRRPDPVAIRRTCRAMDRAARSYVKRAWCLQRSAACVCLLRRQGVPAELVLGVRTFPFGAHAWVELEGRLLNDDLDHVGSFLVLDRL